MKTSKIIIPVNVQIPRELLSKKGLQLVVKAMVTDGNPSDGWQWKETLDLDASILAFYGKTKSG